MIIDTEDGFDLVATAHRCDEGHTHLELHASPDLPVDVAVKMLTDLADKYVKQRTNEQSGLVVVSPAQFRERVREAARMKSLMGFEPFGPPARSGVGLGGDWS